MIKITTFPKVTEGLRPQFSSVGEIVELDSFKSFHHYIQSNSWSQSLFKDNKRTKDNFISADLIALDFDNGISSQEVIDRLTLMSINYSLTFSKSSKIICDKNPKGLERFRLVFDLLKPIGNIEEYSQTWLYLNSLFPESDPSCKDPSRFYFQSCAKEPPILVQTGTKLTPILSQIVKQKTFIPDLGRSKEDFLIIRTDAVNFIRQASSGLDGEFNTSLNRAAFALGTTKVPEDIALFLLESAAPQAFDSSDKTTFKSGYNSGLKKPYKLVAPNKKVSLADGDVFNLLEETLRDRYHVVVDDRGRRSMILQEIGRRVVKRSSLEQLTYKVGDIIREEFGVFLPMAICERHATNWIGYTTPLEEDPKPVAFNNDDSLAYFKLDFEPKPQATPLFDEMMGRMSNNEALMAFTWSIFIPEADRQQYVWLYGDGRNGKSSFATFLEQCLGQCYTSKDASTAYNNKHFTSNLVGKRLAVFTDSNSTSFVKGGLFKSLTGGDSVEVEAKYEQPISLKLPTKFMFLSNFFPEITGKEADQRRLILCELSPLTGKSNPSYNKELWEERAGILHKCKEIYESLVDRNGIIPTDLTQVEEITNEGELGFDSVMSEYLKLDGEGILTPLDLYNLISSSLRRTNIKLSEFYLWMKRKHGIEKKWVNKRRVFVGVTRK